jgi:hypothetical protein
VDGPHFSPGLVAYIFETFIDRNTRVFWVYFLANPRMGRNYDSVQTCPESDTFQNPNIKKLYKQINPIKMLFNHLIHNA